MSWARQTKEKSIVRHGGIISPCVQRFCWVKLILAPCETRGCCSWSDPIWLKLGENSKKTVWQWRDLVNSNMWSSTLKRVTRNSHSPWCRPLRTSRVFRQFDSVDGFCRWCSAQFWPKSIPMGEAGLPRIASTCLGLAISNSDLWSSF